MLALQARVRDVHLGEDLLAWIARLVRASRPGGASPESAVPEEVRKYVRWGAGPRASQYLVLGAKARALTSGRYHVSFEDIRAMAHPVLRHRVLTNFHAQSEGISTDRVPSEYGPAW